VSRAPSPAGDDRAHAADLGVDEPERRQLRQVDQAEGVRPLEREHRDPLGEILELRVGRHVRRQPVVVGVDPRGVDDEQDVIVGEPVGDQVVDRAAVLVQEQRVLRLARLDPVDVVGEHPLHERDRAGAAHLELAHVRHVEEAGMGADGLVLRDDALVLHGHLPPGEGNHPRPRCHMAVAERRVPETLGRVHPGAQSIGLRGRETVVGTLVHRWSRPRSRPVLLDQPEPVMFSDDPLGLREDVPRLHGEAEPRRMSRLVVIDGQLHPLNALGVTTLAHEGDEVVLHGGLLLEGDPAIVVVPERLLVLQQALAAHVVAVGTHGRTVTPPVLCRNTRGDPL
jgi:hypothetical protein